MLRSYSRGAPRNGCFGFVSRISYITKTHYEQKRGELVKFSPSNFTEM
jgi:hypothetical protein